MAFTKKDWKDGSSGGTKLNAAALEDMEERLSDYTDQEVEAEQGAREEADAAHASDTTAVHGIADTSKLATKAEVEAKQDAATAATDAELTAHLNDTTDAHDASAISYAGGTGISAAHVEGAIDELATEKIDKATAAASGTGTLVYDGEAEEWPARGTDYAVYRYLDFTGEAPDPEDLEAGDTLWRKAA